MAFRFDRQELDDLRKSNLHYFRDIRVDESNILQWHGLVVPVSLCVCVCVCGCASLRG